MRTGTAGLDLIKSFEGWRAEAYRDAVGVWTIGYGHTAMAGAPRPVAGMVITRAQGEQLLRSDLLIYEAAVNQALTIVVSQNQFDALVSFCYNVGPGNFRTSSVLRYTNQGRFAEVPGRLMLWNKAKGRVLRGLTRRRTAEAALYITPGLRGVPKPAPQPPAPRPAEPGPVTPQPRQHWLVRLALAIWKAFRT